MGRRPRSGNQVERTHLWREVAEVQYSNFKDHEDGAPYGDGLGKTPLDRNESSRLFHRPEEFFKATKKERQFRPRCPGRDYYS